MKGGCLNVSSPIAAAPGKGQIYRKIWQNFCQKLQFLTDAKEQKNTIQKQRELVVAPIAPLEAISGDPQYTYCTYLRPKLLQQHRYVVLKMLDV